VGSIRKVKHRSGKESWQARWRDPAGKDRARNFARKADAERYLVSVESDKLTGRYADPRLGRMKLEEWITEWQSTRTNLTAQTRLRDDASIRNHILPSIGGVPIGRLQPAHVARWVAELDSNGLAPATVRKAYQLLSATLASAVDNGLIPMSPCRRIQLPRLTQPAMRILDPEEIKSLVEIIDQRYRAMVLTAAYTGLRFGELAALHVERFDALRKSLRVEESLAEVRGEFVLEPPKSDAGPHRLPAVFHRR
jgi:integrase